MRLVLISCIVLALTASALAEESRPRRHLHQLKEMIVKKLFSSSEPNCTQPTEAPPLPPPLETKFFRIPGFNNVVIKAVPKGSSLEPAPVYEKLPPDSQIGIVGSYLGTSTLNETYNALLGVKNLLSSGILSAKRDVLPDISLPQLPEVKIIAAVPSKLTKPCAAPGLRPLPLEPVRVIVKPPKVPVVPTQYSYKQVNQDGSLTTYTNALDLENGIRVTEDGKTLPFFIDRIRKIPVDLPVPVLPEVSKIIVSEVVHPATYSYQQIHQDGRLTSCMGLPSLISKPGPVVVTEMVERIPSPPSYLMDRIDKVATIASFPRAPLIDVATKPAISGHAHAINTPVIGNHVPAPGPMGYSYSQMSVNGGTTTHSASGANAAVLVTENRLPASPKNVFPSFSENNPFRPAVRHGGFSYNQVNTGSQTTSFNGVGDQAGPVNVIEHKPASPSMPLPSNSFSYKQIGDGKMITYTGSGIIEESHGENPTVTINGMDHPTPPAHITDRIEKVAAGAKFNRPPYLIPFAVPIPTGFVHIPTVHVRVPQRPVKMPSTSGPRPFMYKDIHKDGSVTNYGGEGFVEKGKVQTPPSINMAKPFPQGNVRVFKSNNGPFPLNPVNPNAVKPSTPASGSYSYKLVNSDVRGSHPTVGPIDRPIVDTFAAPPPLPIIPAPIQGCIDTDVTNPAGYIANPLVEPSPVLFERPVPLTYSYKQISHSDPNPFLIVNVEDPVMDVKKVNMKISQNDHAYQFLPPPPPPPAPFPSVNVVEHKPAFLQPAPFLPDPNENRPVPKAPAQKLPPSSFSYKQVTSQEYQPPTQPANNILEHRPNIFETPKINNKYLTDVPKDASTPSSFSYKQVTSQAYQPPTQPANSNMEHRPNIFETPKINNKYLTDVPKDASTPSSFSYKQVISQAYPPPLSPAQPTVKIMENKPNTFVQPALFVPSQNSDIQLSNVPRESSPSSSFTYKQITSQEHPPLPQPQQPANHMEHRPSAPPVPPLINSRGSQTQKESAPSSFSYKQLTSQGVYEYSDEFPAAGVKMNLPSNALYPQGNLSGDVYVEQKPLPSPSVPITVSASPIPSRRKPNFDRRNSLPNNPIIVPEVSSFSFKSSNPDGSTITVKNDGHNSMAVQLEEAPKSDSISNSREPTTPVPAAPLANEAQRTESAFMNESTTMPVLEKQSQGPVSGHAKPTRRRVIKRVKPAKQHRGDIPDSE